VWHDEAKLVKFEDSFFHEEIKTKKDMAEKDRTVMDFAGVCSPWLEL
jgi:hypothetical protein